jgi:hypothetical protein
VRGREDHQAHPAAPGPGIDDDDPLAPLAVGGQPLPGLHRRLVGTRDARGEVDGDDLLALREERLVDRDEVPDGRLRSGDHLVGAAQPLVEGVQVGDLRLALLVPLDPDVEADQVDVVLGDELGRQVGGRVGDDRGRGHLGVLPCRRG